MDPTAINLEQVANGLLIVITGILAWLGVRGGRNRSSEPAKTEAELIGALVDASSINKLTAAIEAATEKLIEDGEQLEKGRKLGYRTVEAMEKAVMELSELRRELRELGKTLERRG